MKPLNLIKRPVYCRVRTGWHNIEKLDRFWTIDYSTYSRRTPGIMGFISAGEYVVDILRSEFYMYAHE